MRVYGKKPAIGHMRTLGCLCYAKIVQQLDKLQSRTRECILMGYSETQKGYLLYDHANKIFFVNRDVSFREEVFPFKEQATQTQHLTAAKLNETLSNWSDLYTPDMMLSHDTETTQTPIVEHTNPGMQAKATQVQDDQGQTSNVPQAEEQVQVVARRTARTRKAPLWLKDFVSLNIHQEEPYA